MPMRFLRLALIVPLLLFAAPALALTCTSAAGVNNWSVVATWSCGRVPANGDNVVIAAGSTTTLDVNSNSLASLTVNGTLIVAATLNVNNTAASFLTINNGGTVTIGNNATARAVTVSGDITVAGTGTFSVGATAATHTLTAGGNITNAGTINFRPSATRVCNITFNKNGNQTVSGAGAYTFNLITLNMGATRANILDMQSAMTTSAGFLTITNGTYKHSNASNITPWTAAVTIPANGGFWLNGAASVTTTGFNVSVTGLFQISAGTMTIGNTNAIQLILNNGSTFQMDGGTLTVTGGLDSAATNSTGTFTMSGGTINLQTVSAGTPTSLLLGSGTTFNMSGGLIVLVNGDNATWDMDLRSGTQNVTGGTVQIGSATTTAANQFAIANGGGGTFSLWNLTLGSAPARTIQLGSSINILNDLTIQANNTFDDVLSGTFPIAIGGGNSGGSWTNNGAFTPGTSTVTFTGTSAAPAIGGTTATTFNNLTLNKASNNLTVNTTPTVNGTLTFTSGDIVTGANRVILGTAATIATPSAASYVQGTLQKNYSAGANLSYFAGNDFPVGDATNFTPVNISAGTTTTAGNLTVSTTATEHPQVTTPIASTGIDASKDIARYWTFGNSGLTVGTAISATFTFVAGNVDAGANTANFIVERYDGTNWNPTTLTAANPLNTQASNITPLAAGNNDFAIGEPFPGVTAVPGRFNAFETSTPANSLLGRIYTKQAGVTFSLDVVSINAAKTAYGGAVANVTVALLDSSNNTGALDVNGCRPTWTVVQTFTTTLNIPAGGRATLGGMTVPQAYRDARLRISSAGPLIGCSTDRFTIRPQSFTVTSTNAGNTNTTGAPAIKTGANFNLTAASVAGYDGTPSIDNTQVVGTPTAGAIGGVFGAAPVGTGTATGAGFFYSEVGNFGLNTNAVFDSGFTSVDQPNDCTADFSNTSVGGKYGCSFGSAAVPQTTGVSGFGRFTPDNFNVSYNAPQFGTVCGAGPFTYVGQLFTYATAPVITVTARNGTNNGLSNATTTNYAGAYMKFSNAAGTSLNQAPYNTQGGRYSRFDALGGGTTPVLDTSLLPATTADPVIGTFTAGVGTLTFGSGTGLAFARSTTTPNAPFNADIALALNMIDTDAVAFAGNPASFGAATAGNGIAFNSGKNFRFGRLFVPNTYGTEKLDLTIPVETQYWSGSFWQRNSLDSCTVVAASNMALGNYTGGLNTGNLGASHLSMSAISQGLGTIALTKPSPAATGSVDLAINLGTTGTGSICPAWIATAAGASLAHLRGQWCGANFDKDPVGSINFGISRNKFIFNRENY